MIFCPAERGNVLFYILIAVVLLAALTYAVTQSGRGSLAGINEEKTRLLATQIIEYADSVANATAQLRLRNVKDMELCFDEAQWGVANYNHASCADNATRIFHVAGGGITWQKAPVEATSPAASPDYLWHIYGTNEIEKVGTTCGVAECADLILVTDELSEAVCIQINNILGVGSENSPPPTDSTLDTTRFVGVFDYQETIGDTGGGAALAGRTAACFEKTGMPAKYTFYRVLQAR